jgi:hypothetical protein
VGMEELPLQLDLTLHDRSGLCVLYRLVVGLRSTSDVRVGKGRVHEKTRSYHIFGAGGKSGRRLQVQDEEKWDSQCWKCCAPCYMRRIRARIFYAVVLSPVKSTLFLAGWVFSAYVVLDGIW